MNSPLTRVSPLEISGSSNLTRPESTSATNKSAKLTSSAKEFESILLTTWLQSAETSFGSAPTSDDDQDGGDEQVKSFATQQLAKAWTDAGGIGIASKVASALASPKDQNALLITPTHNVSR